MMSGMDHRKRWLSGVVALLSALSWHVVEAQDADPTPLIAWQCWLGKDPLFSIHCLDVGDRDMLAVNAPASAPLDPQRFRRDLLVGGGAPNLARLVRADAASYGGRLWLIPLYNAPFDMERVTQLARSVMCGRGPRCSVHFEGVGVSIAPQLR